MVSRRRMMSESEDAWNSAYDDNGRGGSEDNNFSGRESIFSDERVDTDNPVLLHNEENAMENPSEGPVQWKMVDGFPVPMSRPQGPAAVQGKEHLRRTLVAVEGPTGVLVARAIRNLKTGQVQHTEAMRLPTHAELQEVQARGQVVPAPTGLSGAEAAVVGPAPTSAQVSAIPWGKVAVGGGVAVAAYLAWKKWMA